MVFDFERGNARALALLGFVVQEPLLAVLRHFPEVVELFVESWFEEIGVVEVGRGVGLKGICEGLCEGFEGEQTFGSAFEPCGGALATSRDDLWQDLQWSERCVK